MQHSRPIVRSRTDFEINAIYPAREARRSRLGVGSGMGVTSLTIAAPKKREEDQRSSQARIDAARCSGCDPTLEADHRIANHLTMLSAYVGLRQKDLGSGPDATTSNPVRLAFDGIRTQIEAVASLHRSLSKFASGSGIDLGDYIRHVCRPFMSGLSGAIEVSEKLDAGCLVRPDQILPLAQIVSEVITNAIKYSHTEGEKGHLSVSCHFVTHNVVEIEIVDDGRGLPQDFDPRAAIGLGFRLIRALAAQIGADSGFESSGAGTRFWLRVEPALEARRRSHGSNAVAQTEPNSTKAHIP